MGCRRRNALSLLVARIRNEFSAVAQKGLNCFHFGVRRPEDPNTITISHLRLPFLFLYLSSCPRTFMTTRPENDSGRAAMMTPLWQVPPRKSACGIAITIHEPLPGRPVLEKRANLLGVAATRDLATAVRRSQRPGNITDTGPARCLNQLRPRRLAAHVRDARDRVEVTWPLRVSAPRARLLKEKRIARKCLAQCRSSGLDIGEELPGIAPLEVRTLFDAPMH